MTYLKILLIFLTYHSLSFAYGNQVPRIEFPDRHVVFQAGKLGHKPWAPEASYGVEINFNAAIFTKLVYVGSGYKILPGIFKKWYWSYKDKSYIFTIDKDLKFSSKRGVTAADVEFALLKSFLSNVRPHYRDDLHDIVGVEKLKVGDKFFSGMCKGVRVLSVDKIQIFLKKSNPNFIYALEESVPPVAPKEDFKKDYFRFKGLPRGTGKYVVEWSSKQNSLVRLKRKAVSKEVRSSAQYPLTIDFFNHGHPEENKVDLAVAAGTSGIRKSPQYRTLLGSIPDSISSIDFNYQHPLGRNIKFREAISLALNRRKMFEKYIQTSPVHEIIPSKYRGRSGLKFEYSPEKARKMVRKWFSKVSSPASPLKAIYHGKAESKDKPHIAELKRQLAEVGLYVNFVPVAKVDLEEHRDAIFREHGTGANYADPISSFAPYINLGVENKIIADSADNKSSKLFWKAKEAQNRLEENKFLKKLSMHFYKNFRVIPVVEGYPVYSLGKRVKTINLEKRISSINFDEVTMAEGP